jgi:hypothetical protein
VSRAPSCSRRPPPPGSHTEAAAVLALQRTTASACRIDAEIKELLLGHTVGKLERIYDRWTYFDERLEALRKIERRYVNFAAVTRANVGELGQA